ncbi:MAG: family 16 glycoside hydrolase [Thermoguttaceae bacterium]
MTSLFRFWCCAVLGLCAFSQGQATAAAAEEGFRAIFDGKTLIWRGGKPGDFEIRAEFRMPNPGFANSGIQIRSWEGAEKWRVSGYQPDMDSANQYTGICYGEGFRGILAGRGEKVTIGPDHKKTVEKFADGKELAQFIKKQDWNEYRITARGNHIAQEINGHLMCELTDNDTVARKDGIIALQIHAGPPMRVEFKNIRLKEFAGGEAAKPGRAKVTVNGGAFYSRGELVPGGTLVTVTTTVSVPDAPAGTKKIVFIAGKPSHGYAQHEHYAGCLLLAGCLRDNVAGVETVVLKGWPKEPEALQGAAAIVIYADGGGGHPVMAHLDEVEKLLHEGVGLACLHYAVEVPKGKPGDLLKSGIGGYFETFWSVNPHWDASFKEFPKHPAANGLKPFEANDEWYYHMRFVDDMKGVTPILTAVPPDSTRREGNDAHGANPHVLARKGMPEHVAWTCQRPDGGRGFGFTGGHWHWTWACDSFRKAVLNGIAWTAKIDIPPDGIPSKTPTLEGLEANQDKPQPPSFDREKVRRMIDGWQKAVAVNPAK